MASYCSISKEVHTFFKVMSIRFSVCCKVLLLSPETKRNQSPKGTEGPSRRPRPLDKMDVAHGPVHGEWETHNHGDVASFCDRVRPLMPVS